jgi:hypothetical protein
MHAFGDELQDTDASTLANGAGALGLCTIDQVGELADAAGMIENAIATPQRAAAKSGLDV